MFFKRNIKSSVESSYPGFYLGDLNKSDLNIFQTLVIEHFNNLLKFNNYIGINFNNYLDNQKLVDHNRIFEKKNRILPKESVNIILNETTLINFISKNFNGINIIDEELVSYPNIYWRVVRPFPYKDVSSFHKDIWYWDLWNHKVDYSKFNRIKIWIALTGNNQKLGFRWVENSVSKDYNYTSEIREGKLKPKFDENQIEETNKVSLIGNAGKFIIFNEKLLHSGEILFSNKPRISCEFTMIYKI